MENNEGEVKITTDEPVDAVDALENMMGDGKKINVADVEESLNNYESITEEDGMEEYEKAKEVMKLLEKINTLKPTNIYIKGPITSFRASDRAKLIRNLYNLDNELFVNVEKDYKEANDKKYLTMNDYTDAKKLEKEEEEEKRKEGILKQRRLREEAKNLEELHENVQKNKQKKGRKNKYLAGIFGNRGTSIGGKRKTKRKHSSKKRKHLSKKRKHSSKKRKHSSKKRKHSSKKRNRRTKKRKH